MLMSKMKMPEMRVVRFNESDVIVASFSLHNYGDGKAHNAYVSYNGRHYGNYSGSGRTYDDLFTQFSAENPGTFNSETGFGWGDQSYVAFSVIMGYDNSDAKSGVDGSYNWNGTTFDHQ